MDKTNTKEPKPLRIFIVILATFFILSCTYVVAGIKAINAGANKEQTIDFLTKHLPYEWKGVLDVTPNPKHDQILTSEQPEAVPMLFIVYRFECPDCEKAYPYINKKIEELPEALQERVWWVPSRTKAGKEFLNKHPIELVPSSVLRTKEGTSIEILYNPDTSDTNTDKIDAVFEELIKQGTKK